MSDIRNGSKGEFEPGLTRLQVRHSTTEINDIGYSLEDRSGVMFRPYAWVWFESRLVPVCINYSQGQIIIVIQLNIILLCKLWVRHSFKNHPIIWHNIVMRLHSS